MGDPRTTGRLRDFGFSLGLAAALTAPFLSLGGAGRSSALVSIAAGLLLAAAALLPRSLTPLEWAWSRTGGCWRRTCENLASCVVMLVRIVESRGPRREP